MEDNKMYVKEKRRFHDAWAFVLYVLYYMGCNSWLILTLKETTQPFKHVNFILLAWLTIGTLSVIALSFLLLTMLCELTIKATVLMFPVALLLLMYFFRNPFTIILGIFGLISWGFIMYFTWSKIPIVAKIVSYSSKICVSHLVACITGIAICSVLQIFQVFLTFLVVPRLDNTASSIVIGVVFLNFYWTLANANYFFKVYIANIIVLHFINKCVAKTRVFQRSLVHTLFALGSISFAGLIIAIVQTIRLMVNREGNSRLQRNLIGAIIICLISMLLSLLESIIEFVNDFTMPYLAVHGNDYVTSVKESANFITTENTTALSGMFLLDCTLFIFYLLMIGVNSLIVSSVLFTKLTVDLRDKVFVYSCINALVCVGAVYFITMSMFISSYLGLIYLYAEKPELVYEADPEIAETLKKATIMV